MNGSSKCHEVEDVPGLYIDAFKGSFLRKTTESTNCFILTHYHGDHYGSLGRDGKYQGPAKIHCTPVTAALLRNVHGVPDALVAQHEYGETWKYGQVGITFYDANHCPGAAIVAIQLVDGTVHLHTGDMRYHPKMKAYPILQEAVKNRKLDLLYLDTTYGHPKHAFVPQAEAVNTIATQVEELLSFLNNKSQSEQLKRPDEPKTLILLSCYSIGKEKVLWESAERTNQLMYVTDRKLAMVECIQSSSSSSNHEEPNGFSDDHVLPCSQMVERCTRNPEATPLHVVPMGLAGELWPFFQPNFRGCVDYEEDLVQNYNRIVAFIPTGWANGSNWNKKNAVSNRRLECRRSDRAMDVEIRLISYSEHSNMPELEAFVSYCRPRKVIPTVFSDVKDRRRLEMLFRKYIDTSRAKLQFFKSMVSTTGNIKSTDRKILEAGCGVVGRKRPPTAMTNDTAAGQSTSNCVDLTSSADEDDTPPKNFTSIFPLNDSATCLAHSTVTKPMSMGSLYATQLKTPPAQRRGCCTVPDGPANPLITLFFSMKKTKKELNLTVSDHQASKRG